MGTENTAIDLDQILAIREVERARMRSGLPGLKADLQKWLRKVMDGGSALKSDDPRQIQAKVLWDKGFNEGFDSFEAYLATIPEIPETLLVHDPDLPLLHLVDPRLGIVKTCSLFGIKLKEFNCSDSDTDAVAYDSRHEIPNVPFWVRAHDGRKNRGAAAPNACRDECKDKLIAMTSMVAIMVWVQDPSIIKEGKRVLDCPGSVPRSGCDGTCAVLHVESGEVVLSMNRVAKLAYLGCGSGAFRWE